MSKKRKTADAIEIMDAEFGHDPEYQEAVATEELFFTLGDLIRSIRKQHNLSQKTLAERAGTSQSAISRLEHADYEGVKLSTLENIFRALRKPLEICAGRSKCRLASV